MTNTIHNNFHSNNSASKYDVLLEATNGEGYTARLLAWPDTIVQAATRESALQQIRALLLQRLTKAEIVTLEIQPAELEHSWLEDFKADVARYRREVDAIHAPWLLEAEESDSQVAPTGKEMVAA
jgi:predicted RNase H-like HicB family nuclease